MSASAGLPALPAEHPVMLTAHPLQRVGAFALAALARVAGMDELTAGAFAKATAMMRRHVAATAGIEDAKSPGGFWLGASYLLWPNAKGLNDTSRKKRTPAERREAIEAWRTYPAQHLDVPCGLCGRDACGFYGKVDVPLGASTEHRNTTAPGHQGLALCRGCLASFHALPYGCVISGGRAAAVHSWDDDFLHHVTRVQVERTRRQAQTSPVSGALPAYAREVTALRRMRKYEHDIRSGVDLYVFSNSNREQVLDVQSLEQPLAEWLRNIMRDPGRGPALRSLIWAHSTPKIHGSALLARNAFRDPHQVVRRAVGYLAQLAADLGAPPQAASVLVPVCRSFSTEVLRVKQHDIERIAELAGRIADLLAKKPERGTLMHYEALHRNSWQLQGWLKRQSVPWVLDRGRAQPLVTEQQWRLLFEPDGQGRFCQDLLFISVLEALVARDWMAKAADEAHMNADRDDDDLFTGEETADGAHPLAGRDGDGLSISEEGTE